MKLLTTSWAVMRKELRDISRDRRTLALALLLSPLLAPVLMIGMNAMQANRAKTELDKRLELPVIGADRAPNLMAFLSTHNIVAVKPPADVDAAVLREDVDVALRIDPEFAEDWHAGRPARVEVISDSTRQNAQIPVARVRSVLSAYGDQVGALRLLARGVSNTVVRPVQMEARDLATPEAKRGGVLALMLPYFLILSSFIGGAYLIIDATAGERERQSLEPLLATPAARGAIVSGKVAAACTMGLLSLLLTLLALKFGSAIGPATGGRLDVSLGTIATLLLILLPMVFIGSSLLTYLSAAAKSVKEAQSHMTWLLLLPMLSTFVLLVNPLKTQLWQYAVPFLAQNQLILRVIRGEAISAQTWMIYLAAGFGLAVVLWYAAVRRYHQERLAISG